MKILIAGLFIALGLLVAPTAAAEGKPGCSNPCVIDEDATQGDITEAVSGWYAGDFGPYNGPHGVIEDNGKQDMEPFAYDPTWPAPDHIGVIVGTDD